MKPGVKRLSLATIFALLVSACASVSRTRSAYPDAWFAPVPVEKKYSWEILPQEAAPGEVILSKRGELGVFSNFAATPFEYRGKKYASVEGFWQMMLFPESKKDPRARCKGVKWKHSREAVAAMAAFEAKKAGDEAFAAMKKCGIDWVSFEGERFAYWSQKPGKHYQLIRDAMQAKLEQTPGLRELLLKTRGLQLKPDHHQEKDAPPEWRYFEIWMQLRDADQPQTLK